MNNGNHGDGVVLARAQIAGEMAASDFITALRQDAACKTARPSARYGDNAHVRSSIAIAFRRRKAVNDFSAFCHAAHKARGIHVVAAQGTNGHIVFIGDVGHAIRGNRTIVVARRRNATVLDRRVINVAGKRRHIQALATDCLYARSRVVNGAATTDLAVVEGATVELAGNQASLKARISNHIEHVVGARNVQGALHDHNVFEVGVDGLAHDNAAAEVSPNVGILDQEALDGGAIGLGKKARIALGIQHIVGVVQTRHGVVLAIENTLEGMLLIAKGEVLDRTRDDVLHIVIFEINIVIETDVPIGRVALARKRHARQKVSRVFDVIIFSLAAGSTMTQQRTIVATAISLLSTPRFMFLIFMG